jgi:hypothetical protein
VLPVGSRGNSVWAVLPVALAFSRWPASRIHWAPDAAPSDAPLALRVLFDMPDGDFIVFDPFEVEVEPVGPPALGVLMPVPPWAAPPLPPAPVPPPPGAPPPPWANAVPASASRSTEHIAAFLPAFMIAPLNEMEAGPELTCRPGLRMNNPLVTCS